MKEMKMKSWNELIERQKYCFKMIFENYNIKHLETFNKYYNEYKKIEHILIERKKILK